MPKTAQRPETLDEVRARHAAELSQAEAREHAAQALAGLDALLADRAEKLAADAEAKASYDVLRPKLDAANAEFINLAREVPLLHERLGWKDDFALRFEYDVKRARLDVLNESLTPLRVEVERLHARVTWNGTQTRDAQIAQYRAQHAAALAAAGVS